MAAVSAGLLEPSIHVLRFSTHLAVRYAVEVFTDLGTNHKIGNRNPVAPINVHLQLIFPSKMFQDSVKVFATKYQRGILNSAAIQHYVQTLNNQLHTEQTSTFTGCKRPVPVLGTGASRSGCNRHWVPFIPQTYPRVWGI